MKNIGQLIKSAMNTINNDLNRFANQYGLTGTQMAIIDFINRHPTHTVNQHALEVEFNVRRSTITVILKRMSDHQLVKRFGSSTDRRQKVVQLTAKGEKLAPIVQDYIQHHDQHLLDGYSVDQVQLFRRMLIHISRGE